MTTDTHRSSTQRLTVPSTNPKVYKALVALQMAAAADFDAELAELIKIRASQINGCAYCLHMHVSDATAMGISDLKLHMVAVWREARNFFSDREQAVLEFTEAVTRLGEHGVDDDVYARAAEHFDEFGMGQLLATVIMINAWNRVAVTSRYPAGADERRS
ncbi:carboxymuconolactone decarboxylase family protein [Williamsia sp.]|uniref:carboxymuconolactone decarboxylase family protein n=1 Tax=Williamsia sp. TaxID=1872085 RepID=UPI001A2CAF29|nr:carboxymuconolactone decarboxylase family protein [Williamsia sp.]MBJ7289769.1 carboxymuconolactone decarboxylase family protein [Williamsia sp.]